MFLALVLLIALASPVLANGCDFSAQNGTCVYQGSSSMYVSAPPNGMYWIEAVAQGVPYGSYVNLTFNQGLGGNNIYKLNVAMGPSYLGGYGYYGETLANFTFDFSVVNPVTGAVITSSQQSGFTEVSPIGGKYTLVVQPTGNLLPDASKASNLLTNGIQTTVSAGFAPFSTSFNSTSRASNTLSALGYVWMYPGDPSSGTVEYVVPFSSMNVQSQYSISNIWGIAVTSDYYQKYLKDGETGSGAAVAAAGSLTDAMSSFAWSAVNTLIAGLPVVGPAWTVMMGSPSSPGVIPIVAGETLFWLIYAYQNWTPLVLLIEAVFMNISTIFGLGGVVIMDTGHGIKLPKMAKPIGPLLNLVNMNIWFIVKSVRGLAWVYDKALVAIRTGAAVLSSLNPLKLLGL